MRILTGCILALLPPITPAQAQEPPVDSVAVRFIARLNDSSSAARDSAQAELVRRAPELLPRFEALLQSDNMRLSFQAARAIVLSGTVALPMIRRIIADRGGTDSRIREALQYAPVTDSAALLLLKPLLEDSSAHVRAAAVSAANPYREGSAALGRALLPKLADPSAKVRAAVPYQLILLRDTTLFAEIPPLLVPLVTDPDSSVRRSAIYALGQFGRYAAVAVPAIAERLRSDPSIEVRWLSARALGWLGGTASPAVPVLLAHLDDPVDTVGVESLIALGSAELEELRRSLADSVLDALGSRLSSDDPQIRHLAVQALARIGSPAVPLLVDALQSPDDSVAIRAALGLAWQPDDERIRKPLLGALADRRESVRDAAALAISGTDTSIRADLERISREGSSDARAAALCQFFLSPAAFFYFVLRVLAWRESFGWKPIAHCSIADPWSPTLTAAECAWRCPPSHRITSGAREPPKEALVPARLLDHDS